MFPDTPLQLPINSYNIRAYTYAQLFKEYVAKFLRQKSIDVILLNYTVSILQCQILYSKLVTFCKILDNLISIHTRNLIRFKLMRLKQ